MGARRVTGCSALAALPLVACAALIGVEDVTYGPKDAGSDEDGGADASGLDAQLVVTDADHAAALCASPHDLCDDFSNPAFPDLSRWTTTEVIEPARIDRSTGDFVTPPASLLPVTTRGSAYLLKTVAGTFTHFVCDFDAKCEPNDAGQEVWHFVFTMHPTAAAPVTEYKFTWGPTDGSGRAMYEYWTLKSGTADLALIDVPGPVVGQWHHVRLDVTIGAASTLALSYNGGLAGTAALPHLPAAHDAIMVRVGAGAYGGQLGGSASIDDIVCDGTR
jgi:hypothetical protein